MCERNTGGRCRRVVVSGNRYGGKISDADCVTLHSTWQCSMDDTGEEFNCFLLKELSCLSFWWGELALFMASRIPCLGAVVSFDRNKSNKTCVLPRSVHRHSTG